MNFDKVKDIEVESYVFYIFYMLEKD